MYEPGSGQGLLADFTPMTNFRLKRQVGLASTLLTLLRSRWALAWAHAVHAPP